MLFEIKVISKFNGSLLTDLNFYKIKKHGDSSSVDTKQLIITDNKVIEISNALSYIWVKTQHRLKNIAITDSRGFLTYGKRTDRLVVDLIDSSGWITETLNKVNEVCT